MSAGGRALAAGNAGSSGGTVLRHSSRDAVLVALAAVHGGLLITVPSAPLIALAMWWNANTIAHNFIHLPFFRSRWANRVFSGYLSLLLGLPQTLWRDRHLAHHAGKEWRFRWSRRFGIELALVGLVWLAAAGQGPSFFFGTWLLGWTAGLILCVLQGHYEHVRGTVSHYGRLYNLAFFNDGYHVEHHARPAEHWTRLPLRGRADASSSRWPAVLRWIELGHLNALERIVLAVPPLQRFVVDRHARAFTALLRTLPVVKRVTVVGGGLFPRTALVLKRLVPDAELTIIDRSPENIERARRFLDPSVKVIEASYTPELCAGADLVVVPLAFAGDKQSFYSNPPARAIAVHDWIWHRHGRGHIISVLLLKRLNLVSA